MKLLLASLLTLGLSFVGAHDGPHLVLGDGRRKLSITVDKAGNVLADDPDKAEMSKEDAVQMSQDHVLSSPQMLGAPPVSHDIMNYQYPTVDNDTLATSTKHFKSHLNIPHHLVANITVTDDATESLAPKRLLTAPQVNATNFHKAASFGKPTAAPVTTPSPSTYEGEVVTEEAGMSTPISFLPTLANAHRHGLYSNNPHHRVAQSPHLLELKKHQGLAHRHHAHELSRMHPVASGMNITGHDINANGQYLGTLGDLINQLGISMIKPTDLLLAASKSTCHHKKRCHKKCNKNGKCKKSCNKDKTKTTTPAPADATTKKTCNKKCNKGKKCGCNKKKSNTDILSALLNEPIYLNGGSHSKLSNHLPDLVKGPYHKPHHLIPPAH